MRHPALGSPGVSDARFAVALAVSFAVHLLLLVHGGDGGPRPAPPAGGVFTARLAAEEPALTDDAASEPLALAPASLLSEAPTVVAPLAEPATARPGSGVAASRASPTIDAPSAAGPVAPTSPGPVEALAPAQPPLPPATPGPGLAPGWFAARDLDVLPQPLSPVVFAVPAAARAAGLSGKVELQLSIDAAGQLVDVEVLRADPRGVFEASAIAAFRAVRYSPGVKDGRTVRSRIRTVAVFDASALAGSELAR